MIMFPSINKSIVDGTFYYDESNNFRKFRLNELEFYNDVNIQSHFTLGGVFLSKKCKPNIDDLLKKLQPKKTQKE